MREKIPLIIFRKNGSRLIVAGINFLMSSTFSFGECDFRYVTNFFSFRSISSKGSVSRDNGILGFTLPNKMESLKG